MKIKFIPIAAILLPLFWQGALAHGPQGHKIRMVAFNRPLPAPGFTLPDPAGNPVALSDFRGRYVLLNFWATWCPPCLREMPSMERLSTSVSKSSFVVLGVSLDKEGAAKVNPYLERLGVTFPIVLDIDSEIATVYGALDLPSTFLIDPQGRVVLAAKGERDWAAAEMIAYIQELTAELNGKIPAMKSAQPGKNG